MLLLVCAAAPPHEAAGVSPMTRTEVVSVAGAASLRLHFEPMDLAEGSIIRISSCLDGQVQELDAAALDAWNHSSAYFNGDTVVVDVVGPAPHRTVVKRIESGPQEPQPVGGGCQFCGICGDDDRVPSSELWVARMLPAACTAVVIDRDGCMVTAGHCAGATPVVQFNVPRSNPNCSPNHPPIEDQFPATVLAFRSNGPGDDWCVLRAGANSLGQTPFERYGEMRPIARDMAPVRSIVSVTGYGASCVCTLSFTQQTAEGPICDVHPESTAYQFAADYRIGADGAALLLGGAVIGGATHCPCCNIATMVQNAGFAEALAGCPGACPWDLDGDGSVGVVDLLALLVDWGEAGVPADFDGGGVGATDLLLLLARWGTCP